MVTPFTIDVPDTVLADLRARLANTRWPDAEPVRGTDDPWSQGVPFEFLADLAGYWRDAYDWRAREAHLNTFPQFTTDIDGHTIHFVHVRSREPDALLETQADLTMLGGRVLFRRED